MEKVAFNVSARYLRIYEKFLSDIGDTNPFTNLPFTNAEKQDLAVKHIEDHFDKECRIRKILQKRYEINYKDEIASANKEKCDKRLMKLDIRPHPELKINDFYKLLKSIFLKDNLFDLIKLVFEQRGDTDETLGNGFHCHSVVKCLNDNKDFKIATLNKLKTIIKKLKLDHILTLNCIEFKAFNTLNYLNNHLKYTDVKTFNKSNVYKKSAWENDARWRKSLNLKDEYTCNADFIDDPFETPLSNFMKIQSEPYADPTSLGGV